MPVDYSRWEAIELSDDDNFECHPNVDKGSMIRWKQADIHKRRREAKDALASLERELSVNITARTEFCRLKSMFENTDLGVKDLKENFISMWKSLAMNLDQMYSKLFEQYMADLSKDRDYRWGPPEPAPFVTGYVSPGKLMEEMSAPLADSDQIKDFLDIGEKIVAKIHARHKAVEEYIAKSQEENRKKITMEDVRVGFDKTVITTSEKKEPLGELTMDDRAKEFSKVRSMSDSREYIVKHPKLLSQDYVDVILSFAFEARMAGRVEDSNLCVRQALLLQYSCALGEDGLSRFFDRIKSPECDAAVMFFKDVADTCKRIDKKVKQWNIKEKKKKKEILERIGRNESGSYIYPLPESPTEMDLRAKEVFSSLSKELQEAVLTDSVDSINAYLGTLTKEEGEKVVKLWSEVGLINFEDESLPEDPDNPQDEKLDGNSDANIDGH